jgi:ATP-binding protein involved in chromosome partitioning
VADATKEDIRNALRAVKGPDQRTDIVKAGYLRNVALCEGVVKVEALVPTVDPEVLAFLKSHIYNVVKVLPGVNEVNVEIEGRAEQPDESGPTGVDRVKSIISVGSGKGGVGKSTVAVNLAVALARQGAAVGLLDTDVYGPSVPMMLGVKEPPETDGEWIIPLEAHGVKFMSLGLMIPDDQPVIWRGPMLHKTVQQFATQVQWGELDYLIVDLPPGTGDVHLSLMQTIDLTGAVVVSTPQAVSLLDAGKALQMFKQTGATVLGMVENMSYYICPNCEHRDYLFGQGGVAKHAQATGVPFLGEIPLVKSVREGGDAGTPVLVADPDGAVAQAYAKVAERLKAEVARIRK